MYSTYNLNDARSGLATILEILQNYIALITAIIRADNLVEHYLWISALADYYIILEVETVAFLFTEVADDQHLLDESIDRL